MMRRVGQHQNIIAVLGATPDSTVIVFEEALTDLHVIVSIVCVCMCMYVCVCVCVCVCVLREGGREGGGREWG
jgi:hypothetical protein